MKTRTSILPGLRSIAALVVLICSTSAISFATSSLKVEYATYEVRESEGPVVIAVLRAGATDSPASVDYSTANIIALEGLDYSRTAGQLTFSPGETLKLISIPITTDWLKEGNETFRVTLANPIGAALDSQKSSLITIRNSDHGIGFKTGRYYVQEDEGLARIEVRRGASFAAEPASVDFSTVNSTAIAGLDYVATNGTLSFSAGELSRNIEVAIINDGVLEADETFRIVLSAPTGGATLGAQTNLFIQLCDATGAAPHGFAAIRPEGDGVVKLTFSGGVSKRFQPYFDIYPVEVSTNLVDWRMLTLLQRTNSATDEFVFLDAGAKENSARFYRIPTNHFTAAYSKPSGPYLDGRHVRMMHDSSRRNRYLVSTNGSFAVTIIYPAAPNAGQRPAPWFEEALARDTSVTSLWAHWNVSAWFDRVPFLSSYSFQDAPLAEISEPVPVVLYSPGFTVDRAQDIEKLEFLASHGYLVVTMEHSDALDVVWPDGFYYSVTESAQEDLNDRARDLVFVLDELTKWNQDDPKFAGRIALDRIGAMGMSWGGASITLLAEEDSRCRAVVVLDPGFTVPIAPGFPVPSMTMHRSDLSDQSLFAASNTNAVWFQLSNTDHGSFANYVIFSPPPLTLAGNQDAQRTIQAYTLSFFNKWLKGQDDHLHESASSSHPRVVNFQAK